MLWGPHLIVALVAVGSTAAVEAEAPTACEGLFGDLETQSKNRERREELLESVDLFGNVVALTHRGDWTTPTAVRLHGVELLDIVRVDDRGPMARLFLRDVEGCADGIYAVDIDAAIGAEIAVVAITADVLLLEVGEELRYLVAPGADSPTWLLAYHWPYRFAPTASRAAPAAPARNNRKRR